METRGDIKFYRDGVESSLSEDLNELEAEKVSFDELSEAPSGEGILNNYYTKTETNSLVSTTAAGLQNQISVNRQDILSNTTNITANTQDITAIEGKIPAQASTLNQLADKNFVNSSINAIAAFYITYNAQGDPFPTKTALNSATVFYCGGETRVPTKNDYCLVLADESKGTTVTGYTSFTTTAEYVGSFIIYNNAEVEVTTANKDSVGIVPGTTVAYETLPTTRYVYSGDAGQGQWDFQFIVNETPFTADQLAAINSGITSTLVQQIPLKADITNWNQTVCADTLKLSNQLNLMYPYISSTNQCKLYSDSQYINNNNSLADVTAVELYSFPLRIDKGNANRTGRVVWIWDDIQITEPLKTNSYIDLTSLTIDTYNNEVATQPHIYIERNSTGLNIRAENISNFKTTINGDLSTTGSVTINGGTISYSNGTFTI